MMGNYHVRFGGRERVVLITRQHPSDPTIAFAQLEPHIAREEFQLWILKVDPEQTAHLICEDGNGEVVSEKLIEYTDFPLSEIKLYFTNNVILLPSEY